MGTQYSVFSRLKGENLELDHHAMGNQFNLYTEVDTGYGGRGYGEAQNNRDETYWGIKGIREDVYLPTECRSTFVGIKTSEPTSISSTWHHETIAPDTLSPQNMWIAQMAYKGKYVPPDVTLTLPPPPPDVRKLLPIDDGYTRKWSADTVYGGGTNMMTAKYGGTYDAYLKYDLTGVNFGSSSVAAVTLKIWVEGVSSNFGVQLYEVHDDTWSEFALTYNTRPSSVAIIPPACSPSCDATYVYPGREPGWIELDVTNYFNRLLGGTDRIMSLHVTGGGLYHNKDSILSFPSKEGGNPPHLVVHEFAKTVPPPMPPAGLTAATGSSSITLNWIKNLEFDLASYNVYRHDGTGIYKREAMGLTTNEYTDYAVWSSTTYSYVVTAVDIAGSESIVSSSVSGVLGTVVATTPAPPTTTAAITTVAPPVTTAAPPVTTVPVTTLAPPVTTASPSTCNDYGSAQMCRVHGCDWKGSCRPFPTGCSQYRGGNCKKAGCTWDRGKCF